MEIRSIKNMYEFCFFQDSEDSFLSLIEVDKGY